MKKKKSSGGGANWMDTYGDMVTLLLCFFVLLFSMATITDEKWKAIVMSFNPDAIQSMTETSGNDGPFADPNEDEGSGMGLSQAEIDNSMDALFDALQELVSSSNAEGSIAVSKGGGQIFISFNQAVFFDGNDWHLREESKPILDAVSQMLSDVSEALEEVRVVGHTAQGTPDEPNDPVVDRMLSAQRAANVLAYVQTHTILDPGRMISEGCGQWRPIADNATSEGRQKNRRVEMVINGRDLEKEIADGIQEYVTVTGGASGSETVVEPPADSSAPAPAPAEG